MVLEVLKTLLYVRKSLMFWREQSQLLIYVSQSIFLTLRGTNCQNNEGHFLSKLFWGICGGILIFCQKLIL